MEKHWILAYDTTNIKNSLNRTTGGDKDFILHPVSIERNRQAHIGLYEGENNPAFGMKHSKKTKEYLSSLARQRTGNKNHMFGKHHSEEAKEKMRIAQLGRYDGEDNPFFWETPFNRNHISTMVLIRRTLPHQAGKRYGGSVVMATNGRQRYITEAKESGARIARIEFF